VSEKLQWFFEMVDKVTAPGAKIRKEFKNIDGELKKLQKTDGFKHLAESAKKAREPVNAVGKALAKVAASAAGMAVAGAGLLAVGGKYVLDSVAFKRNTVASLEAIEGSKKAAQSAYTMIEDYASRTGFDDSSVLDAYTKLRRAGFDVASTKVALAGAFDVAARNMPNASQSIEAVTNALVEMTREGKLTTGMLDAIADAGGPTLMDVAKNIKGLEKLNERQARAMIDGGIVRSMTGQKAIFNAINAKMNKGAGIGASALAGADSPEA
jgi:hypothetical protein